MKFIGILLFFLLCIKASTIAQNENRKVEKPKTIFTFGGYAKLDIMMTRFEGGEPATDSPTRDIHFPGGITIGGKESFDTHFHVKESRFNIDIASEILNKPVRVYIEMDFLLSKQGDQRVSNSYSPRIRHFYFDYGNWTFGQTWSNFMNVIVPDDLDFVGAAEGVVFNRQPQVRYTAGTWSFALELPETTLTPNGGGAFETHSGGLLDFSIKKAFNGDWGNMGVSGLIRNVRYYDSADERHGALGMGLSSGAMIKVGQKDDIRASITYGQGLGRYVALAFLNAGVIRDDLEVKTINSINGYISYLHYWNEKWRSSVNYSFLEADNDVAYTGMTANKKAWSASVNLIYSPAPQLLFGIECMYGYRELESGEGDGFLRVQFSARYSFKYSSTNK